MPVNLCGKLAGKDAVVAYTQMDGGPLRIFRRDDYGIFVNRIGRRHVLHHHALQVAQPHLLAADNHLVQRLVEEHQGLQLVGPRRVEHHNIIRLPVLRFDLLDIGVSDALRSSLFQPIDEEITDGNGKQKQQQIRPRIDGQQDDSNGRK